MNTCAKGNIKESFGAEKLLKLDSEKTSGKNEIK